MKRLLTFLSIALVLASCGRKTTPPQMDSSDFVDISEVAEDILLEIRYYSTYNFVGDRIDGYQAPLALMTREGAAALKKASDEVLAKGYRLKVFDAYRPQTAVNHFIRWAENVGDVRMKPYFYPDVDKSLLFELGFICAQSSHSRGSTVDLTLFDMETEREVDMGGTFDWFGKESYADFSGITDEQKELRKTLRDAMVGAGFKPYETEWWHFTLADEPFPDTYFDFPVSRLALKDACCAAGCGK